MADPDAVVEALGLPPAVRTERLDGYDAVVWRADLADGRTVAVRLLRAGVDARAELAALRLAAVHTALAPALLAAGRYGDRVALALSWCAGRPVADLLREGAPPHSLGRAFGRAQHDLHRPVAGQVLCHLDYQPFNVLMTGGRVSGIVDWANARVGDPRADVAWTRVVLDLAPALVPGLDITAFAAGWRDGYDDFPDGDALRPFLARAARRQCADWERRAGACPPAALTTVRDIEQHYSQ